MGFCHKEGGGGDRAHAVLGVSGHPGGVRERVVWNEKLVPSCASQASSPRQKIPCPTGFVLLKNTGSC